MIAGPPSFRPHKHHACLAIIPIGVHEGTPAQRGSADNMPGKSCLQLKTSMHHYAPCSIPDEQQNTLPCKSKTSISYDTQVCRGCNSSIVSGKHLHVLSCHQMLSRLQHWMPAWKTYNKYLKGLPAPDRQTVCMHNEARDSLTYGPICRNQFSQSAVPCFLSCPAKIVTSLQLCLPRPPSGAMRGRRQHASGVWTHGLDPLGMRYLNARKPPEIYFCQEQTSKVQCHRQSRLQCRRNV
jgi:hypothetical protein